jgi:hypothetical protein
MNILFSLFVIFAFHWLAGFATTILLQATFPISFYRIRAIRLTLPIAGYAVSSLIWWVATFRLMFATETAIMIGAGCAVASIAVMLQNFSKRLLIPLLPAKCDWPVLIIIPCVIAISGWPYLTAGMGHYFLVNETDYFLRVIPSVLVHNQVPADLLRASGGVGALRDLFPLQLSNLTLLQRLLGHPANDCAVLQAIVDLLYTAIGVYWLSRYIVRFRLAPSVAAAVFSVIAQFYFHTYLSGHIGSMLYAAMAPVFFGLCAWALARDRYRTTLLIIAVLWLFMGKAYPLVSYLLLPSLAIAKLRLMYLDQNKRWIAWASKWLVKSRLSTRAALILISVIVLVLAIPSYYVARALFYPNRISLIFVGYQPMLIVFNRQVFEWFYGLRLAGGFGYGFLEGGGKLMDFYATFAFILSLLLTGIAIFMCMRLWRDRLGSFLSMFLLFLPVLVFGFVMVWPFSYLIYKALYVHYFFIVIAVVGGLHYFLRATARRGTPLVRAAVCVVICIVGGINAFGSYKNGAIFLDTVRRFDLGDLYTLVGQMESAKIASVTVPGYDLSSSVMNYGLQQAGIARTTDVRVGHLLMTAQHTSFTPIENRDIFMKSSKGKYVLSYTPDSVLEVYSSLATSTEVRNGVVFRWLATEYDYNSFTFANAFRGLAAFLRSLPGSPPVYNDFSDSGYYLAVDELLKRQSIRRSSDPRQCLYFVRLNRKVSEISARIMAQSSAVVASVIVAAGKQRVVEKSYVEANNQVRVWSNDLFEVVFIPMGGREMSAPADLDVQSLAEVIRNRGLAVANGVSAVEYEHSYLEDKMQALGVHFAAPGSATAVLLCVPKFILDGFGNGSGEIVKALLWRSSDAFSRAQGYGLVLVPLRVARLVLAVEGTVPSELVNRPMRTIYWPFKGDLWIRAHRSDMELRVVWETGPSFAEETTIVRAMRRDGQTSPIFFRIDKPSQVLTVPVDHFARPGEESVDIVFESDVQLVRRVMPYDDRLLIYRVPYCVLVKKNEKPYTDAIKRVLRANWSADESLADTDIVEASSRKELALGVGWFQRELAGGVPYRWMADGAEIVLEAEKTSQKRIVIAGEVGASAPSGRISIVARLNGTVVANHEADYRSGRAEIVLDCDSPSFMRAFRQGQNVISLATKGGGRKIRGDTRVLNFRVFRIALAENSSFGAVGARR